MFKLHIIRSLVIIKETCTPASNRGCKTGTERYITDASVSSAKLNTKRIQTI